MPTVFLKVHLYSTLEVRQTTTIHVPLALTCRELFLQICQKRKYDPKDYVLRMADTKTDVPLDKTLERLRLTEFCVVKKGRGGGMYLYFFFMFVAGDIFLTMKEEASRESLHQSSVALPGAETGGFKVSPLKI